MVSGNYGWGLPVQASTFAKEIDLGIWIIHSAMILIFMLWGAYFIYLLAKHRARAGVGADRSDISHTASLAPDIAVLVFEVLLVLFYAIPSWSRIKVRFPESKGATDIEITAEQFNWNIRYPGPDGKFGALDQSLVDFANPLGLDPQDPAGKDDIVLVNNMVLPVDRPVRAQLTSKDVVHSFFIPSFRIKQDATPGLMIPVWFQPTRIGDYEITCAQLCGVGHAIMRADVQVKSQEDFDAWLAAQSAASRQAAAAPAPVEEW